MTDTLHDRLKAELDRRLAVARAATPGPWTWDDDDMDESIGAGDPDSPDVILIYSHYGADDSGIPLGRHDGSYIALHDPADAIRRYTGELVNVDE